MSAAPSSDSVVLVTGGNRGIGRAIAERYVRDGWRVAVTMRSGEGPEGTLSVQADVDDGAYLDAAIARVEDELGPVTTVVANAGITRDTLLMRMSDDDFDAVVGTNLGGAFRTVKRAIRSMIRARRGRIVFVSSVVRAVRRGWPGQLLGVQVRPRGARALDHPRARLPRHHRERRRPPGSSRAT